MGTGMTTRPQHTLRQITHTESAAKTSYGGIGTYDEHHNPPRFHAENRPQLASS